MIDIEDSVRRVLHGAVDNVAIHPDEADVARRVRRARRRRDITLAVNAVVVALAIGVLAIIVAQRGRDRGEPSVEDATTSTVVGASTTATPATVPATTTPATTFPQATTAPPPRSHRFGFRVVTIDGANLVETRDDGSRVTVGELPNGGTSQYVLSGAGNHLVVGIIGYVFMYDTSSWAPPAEVGNYFNNGVIPVDNGFWAATVDQPGEPGRFSVTWQRRDWSGSPVGPAFAALPDDGLPIGAVGDGLALMTMHDGHVLAVTTSGTRDLGVGRPIAASGTQLAFRRLDGDVVVYDATSERERVVGNLGPNGPAQTTGAGSFSPDGKHLAVAVSDDQPPYPARGVVVYGLDEAQPQTTSQVIDIEAFAAAWTPDGSRLVVSSQTGVSLVDPASGESSRLVEWDETSSRQAVVLPA